MDVRCTVNFSALSILSAHLTRRKNHSWIMRTVLLNTLEWFRWRQRPTTIFLRLPLQKRFKVGNVSPSTVNVSSCRRSRRYWLSPVHDCISMEIYSAYAFASVGAVGSWSTSTKKTHSRNVFQINFWCTKMHEPTSFGLAIISFAILLVAQTFSYVHTFHSCLFVC